jgi:hypothetical protein
MTKPPPVVIDDKSSEAQLLDAAAIIARGESRVVFDGLVELSATPTAIRCEVIDPTPGAHRCAEEFGVLRENAARALEGSRLAALLPVRPWRWIGGAD